MKEPNVALVTCRPVDWSLIREMAPDLEETPVYPGSMMTDCSRCSVKIWLGPEQQDAIEKAEATWSHQCFVVCFLCAIALSDNTTPVKSLGNDFKKEQ